MNILLMFLTCHYHDVIFYGGANLIQLVRVDYTSTIVSIKLILHKIFCIYSYVIMNADSIIFSKLRKQIGLLLV